MSSLSPERAIPPLKSFALTHILYDPSQPISIPLTLLSLSPIFLFVSYFTLLVFNRRLTLLLLAIGSLWNEALSWALKRLLKGTRPYAGLGEVGEGYGMPSSHTQAAAFLVAWGIGYVLTAETRRLSVSTHSQSGKGKAVKMSSREQRERARLETIRSWRTRIYLFGLILWSVLVAYSRWHLLYHSSIQVVAGYVVGLCAGTTQFIFTEYIPLAYPSSILGRCRSSLEWLWKGIGGVGGHEIGDFDGGWGEGPLLVDSMSSTRGQPIHEHAKNK